MKNLYPIPIILLLIFMAGCQSGPGKDMVAAVVNGVEVSQEQLDLQYRLLKYEYEQQQGVGLDEIKDQDLIIKLQQTAFENAITQVLIREDAKQKNVTVAGAEIDKALEQFKNAQNSSNKSNGYQDFLNRLNMNEKDIKTQIETIMLTSRLQEKVVTLDSINDSQAQKYYQDNPGLFKDEGGLQIYHILVDNESLAKQLIERLKKGEEFSSLAQQYSIDPGSKEKGGDVGIVNGKTNFVPEFKQAALSLKPAQLYDMPVKSTFGYHIIKAGETQAPVILTFDEVKEQIKQQLAYEQKDQAFSNYIQNLRKQADIQDKRSAK